MGSAPAPGLCRAEVASATQASAVFRAFAENIGRAEHFPGARKPRTPKKLNARRVQRHPGRVCSPIRVEPVPARQIKPRSLLPLLRAQPEERAGERRRLSTWLPWSLDQLPNLWWHIAMVVRLPHHRLATGSLMQSVPDFQQHALAILPPLMVPEPQLFNSLRREK